MWQGVFSKGVISFNVFLCEPEANPSRGQEFSDEAFSGSIVRVCRALSAVKELCHVVRCALSTKAREGTVDITLISSSQQPGEVHNHSAS